MACRAELRHNIITYSRLRSVGGILVNFGTQETQIERVIHCNGCGFSTPAEGKTANERSSQLANLKNTCQAVRRIVYREEELHEERSQ